MLGHSPSAKKNKLSILDTLSPVEYNVDMKYQLTSTSNFNKWFSRLKDPVTKRKILARLARVENGHFGDYKQIDENLLELRFFFGGALRIYYAIRDNQIVLLLAGGKKSSQANDIDKSKRLLKDME